MGMFDSMSKSPMVKDIVEEVVAMIGFQAKYLPRKYGTAIDPIFGEDPSSFFDTVWTLTLKPWEYGSEAITVVDPEITAITDDLDTVIDKALTTPDWDSLDDDIFDLSEMNPFGSTQ